MYTYIYIYTLVDHAHVASDTCMILKINVRNFFLKKFVSSTFAIILLSYFFFFFFFFCFFFWKITISILEIYCRSNDRRSFSRSV